MNTRQRISDALLTKGIVLLNYNTKLHVSAHIKCFTHAIQIKYFWPPATEPGLGTMSIPSFQQKEGMTGISSTLDIGWHQLVLAVVFFDKGL